MEWKFCTSCGAPLEGANFCTHCGHQVSGEGEREHHDTASQQSASASGQRAEGGGPASVSGAAATAVADDRAETQDERLRSPVAPAPPTASPGGPPAMPSPTPAPGPQWRAIGLSAGITVIVAAVVAIVLLAAGGKPAAHAKNPAAQTVQLTNTLLASRQLYASTQQPSYSTLLPAGWQQVPTTTSTFSAATTVKSPVDGGATITVGQVATPAKTLRGEAARILKAASTASGFSQQVNAASALAGRRPAWVIAFNANGQTNAYYLINSCSNMYAVSASVPPDRASVLRPRIGIVASTLQGNC